MSTNTVPVVSATRQPRAIVQANGTVITGWTSIEVAENDFFHPSTFRVDFALSALPSGNDASWWATQGAIEIEVFVGFPPDPVRYSSGDLTSIFYGRVDEASVHWDQRLLEISGRDLSSKLADVKSADKYPNLTASAIATKLAGKYGLTPIVTSTSTRVGKYYKIDHVDLHDERTEWDLLTWLAREEQFVVFVKGKELHFQPKPDAGQSPYLVKYVPPTTGSAEGNFTRLTTARELTIAKDIKVTVRSWNAKHKKAYTRVATRKKGSGSKAGVQEYSYTIAGLDPDQAQARANQILAELSQHEVKLSLEGPADNDLTITDVIQLQGTGTAFDQVYYPDQITRTFSLDEGYRWMVEAKNHATTSEPAL